jgi:hypothetical protein
MPSRTVADSSVRVAFVDSDKLNPRQRGKYIPAPVRRAVWKRDGGRCTYVDCSGQRCCETSYVELHHEQPHARATARAPDADGGAFAT